MTIPNPILETRLADTESKFRAWLRQATWHDTFQYHRGFLAVDASVRGSLGAQARDELGRIARLAWSAAENGRVHLLQRRHGPNDTSYLAVARGKPAAAKEDGRALGHGPRALLSSAA